MLKELRPSSLSIAQHPAVKSIPFGFVEQIALGQLVDGRKEHVFIYATYHNNAFLGYGDGRCSTRKHLLANGIGGYRKYGPCATTCVVACSVHGQLRWLIACFGRKTTPNAQQSALNRSGNRLNTRYAWYGRQCFPTFFRRVFKVQRPYFLCGYALAITTNHIQDVTNHRASHIV